VWGATFPKFEPPPVRVALSVSDGEGTDADALGRVFQLVCEGLIDRGHTLLYGGLPQFGFTQQLAAYVARRQGEPRVGRHVQNYVAAYLDTPDARDATQRVGLQYVPVERAVDAPTTDEQEIEDLAALRRKLTDDAHVRVVVGGRIAPMVAAAASATNRRAPGVLEEAYLSLVARRPLLVAGGFGGCGRVLAHLLQGEEDRVETDRIAEAYATRDGLAGAAEMLAAFRSEPLAPNGLSAAENRELWATTDPVVVRTLVLRAVERLGGRGAPR
jgi:hypothetical protein